MQENGRQIEATERVVNTLTCGLFGGFKTVATRKDSKGMYVVYWRYTRSKNGLEMFRLVLSQSIVLSAISKEFRSVLC